MLRYFILASLYIIFITSLGTPALASQKESSRCDFTQQSKPNANNPRFQGSSKITGVDSYRQAFLDALTKARQELERDYPGAGYLDRSNSLNCRVLDISQKFIDRKRVMMVTIELIP